MNLKSIHKILLSSAIAATVAFSGAAQAGYPEKQVSYIIPFGPGGESDITARHQQPFFKKLYKQDLIISYKPGGGGTVGWSQLNGKKGDGYTIMGINLPHIILKPLQKDVGFTTKDITGVYMFHYTPDALLVKEDSPHKTLADYIAHAKKNPKQVITSGSGKGSANHLAQVTLDNLAGIKTTYVPFKGTGKAVAAILGNQVEAEWGYTSVGAKHEGKLRMLAVATEERHPRFPNVPTFKELGFDIVSGAYRGIAVPKSASEDVRRQVSNFVKEINSDPQFRKNLEKDGMVLLDIDYDKMDAFIAEKTALYTKSAKQAGILK